MSPLCAANVGASGGLDPGEVEEDAPDDDAIGVNGGIGVRAATIDRCFKALRVAGGVLPTLGTIT